MRRGRWLVVAAVAVLGLTACEKDDLKTANEDGLNNNGVSTQDYGTKPVDTQSSGVTGQNNGPQGNTNTSTGVNNNNTNSNDNNGDAPGGQGNDDGDVIGQWARHGQ